MPDGLSINVDPKSLADFRRALADTERVSRRSAGETVKYGFVRYCKAYRSRYRSSKRRHDVIERMGREYFTDQRGRTRWRRAMMLFAVKLRQRGEARQVPISSRSDPKRLIRRRGLGKESFGWMMAGVHGVRWKSKATGSWVNAWSSIRHYRYTTVKVTDRSDRGGNPFIDFENRLGYLLKSAPALPSVSMASAAAYMQKMLDMKTARELERVWR